MLGLSVINHSKQSWDWLKPVHTHCTLSSMKLGMCAKSLCKPCINTVVEFGVVLAGEPDQLHQSHHNVRSEASWYLRSQRPVRERQHDAGPDDAARSRQHGEFWNDNWKHTAIKCVKFCFHPNKVLLCSLISDDYYVSKCLMLWWVVIWLFNAAK